MASPDVANNTFSLVVFTTLLGFIPMAMLLLTAYIKISVVLTIIRNALGLQQTPSNIILAGIATVLSLYISAPVITDVYDALSNPSQNYRTVEDWKSAFESGAEPVRGFLEKHTTQVDRAFFSTAAEKVWGPERAQKFETDSIFILMPAFLVHELTAAFKIGFMLFIPFLAIDIIVANVLMALGMMMMSPTVVSVPFKLFLFVAVDGWNLLVRGLVLSYAT